MTFIDKKVHKQITIAAICLTIFLSVLFYRFMFNFAMNIVNIDKIDIFFRICLCLFIINFMSSIFFLVILLREDFKDEREREDIIIAEQSISIICLFLFLYNYFKYTCINKFFTLVLAAYFILLCFSLSHLKVSKNNINYK